MKNPYVVDRPLTDQDLFFGRELQFSQLSEALSAGVRLLLLYGEPRVGKTSFLNQLSQRLSVRYTVRRIEWLPSEGQAPDLLWAVMLRIAEALGQTPPDRRAYEAEPEVYARDYLYAFGAEAKGATNVFCFDALPKATFGSRKGWQEAFARLHAVLEGVSGLAIVLAIEGSPRDTGLLGSPIDRPQIVLGPLEEEETEELLTAPVRGVLAWDYEAVRHVHRLTGGHPFFVQLFGRIVFDQRARAGWVGISEVEHVIDRVITQGSPEFERIWEACTPATRIALCAFAEMVGYSHGVGSGEDLGLYLSRLGVQMPGEDVARALDELVAQNVFERLGGGTFRFTNELFRRWLKRSHNTLETVRQARDYRRVRIRPTVTPRRKRMDWLGLFLWLVAGFLVLVIAFVWRSRPTGIIWSAGPTPPTSTEEVNVAPTAITIAPNTGVSQGRIAYMARENPEGNWQIYSMRSDGSDPTRLTHNEHNDTLPTWSPDGRKIAFVSDRDGNREIYVMNADGTEQINLTLNLADDWTPAWSPDGKRIAFASFRDGDWEIYVMDARGANPTRLTKSKGVDAHPAWSPDGQRIAFVSDRDGNLEIYIMAADGSNPVRFTHHEATDQNPTWSPDGQQLFWESYRDGNMEIYAANTDGSNLHNITRDPQADDRGPTCSPWGRQIAFFSNRDRGWDIYTLDLETGVRTNLTTSVAQEQAPSWGR